MIPLKLGAMSYCNKCDTYSVVYRNQTVFGIPVRKFWCKNLCGNNFEIPIDPKDIELLAENRRKKNERNDSNRQMQLIEPPSSMTECVVPSDKLESESGYLYHATNLDGARDIIRTGFLSTFPPYYGTDQDTWPDGSDEDRSYWSASAGNVWQFAPEHGKPVILRTRQTNDFKREKTGDYYTTVAIPSRNVEALTTINGWISLDKINL